MNSDFQPFSLTIRFLASFSGISDHVAVATIGVFSACERYAKEVFIFICKDKDVFVTRAGNSWFSTHVYHTQWPIPDATRKVALRMRSSNGKIESSTVSAHFKRENDTLRCGCAIREKYKSARLHGRVKSFHSRSQKVLCPTCAGWHFRLAWNLKHHPRVCSTVYTFSYLLDAASSKWVNTMNITNAVATKLNTHLADLSNYQPTQFQPVGLCKKSTGNQPCSNPHVGKRSVFVKPTVIPTMCFKIRRLERGWFLQNQPSFQPRLWYTKVETRLVFAKPTVGFPIWGLEHSWLPWNQPLFQSWVFVYHGWRSVDFGLIFCTKQLSTVGPVREGHYSCDSLDKWHIQIHIQMAHSLVSSSNLCSTYTDIRCRNWLAPVILLHLAMHCSR